MKSQTSRLQSAILLPLHKTEGKFFGIFPALVVLSVIVVVNVASAAL